MTRTWYFPSWNGDFRLEAESEGDTCVLLVEKPTLHEQTLINSFLAAAKKKRWSEFGALQPKKGEGPYRTDEERATIPLSTSLAKAGQLLVELTKPQDRTITAVKFEDGKLAVAEAADSGALAEQGKKAATVSRHTPCCPQCVPGSVERASEVLLSFLNEAEHHDWAHERAILVTGGQSGHRYLLAHRHSPLAVKLGRICYDLDDHGVVHFHDWSVPPEEEVLAAKLILEHREPWLRNEATCLYGHATQVFKNPFGDIMDGTADAGMMQCLGAMLAGFQEGKQQGFSDADAQFFGGFKVGLKA